MAADLAYLAAATLHLADRPLRFRWQRGADHRLHLMHDGYPVATASRTAAAAEQHWSLAAGRRSFNLGGSLNPGGGSGGAPVREARERRRFRTDVGRLS